MVQDYKHAFVHEMEVDLKIDIEETGSLNCPLRAMVVTARACE